MSPSISNVNVEKVKDTSTKRGFYWKVTPIWTGVDRPDGFSISCGGNHKVAQRLKKAFLEGAVYKNASVHRDIEGKTFVLFALTINMRRANHDLTQLGF